jgi:hypothetical protein
LLNKGFERMNKECENSKSAKLTCLHGLGYIVSKLREEI